MMLIMVSGNSVRSGQAINQGRLRRASIGKEETMNETETIAVPDPAKAAYYFGSKLGREFGIHSRVERTVRGYRVTTQEDEVIEFVGEVSDRESARDAE